MKSLLSTAILVLSLLILFVVSAALYTVSETEQVVITQFGQPVGEAVTAAGLHVKMPFIQQVNRFEKRVLDWDGPSTKMPTKDKLYIVVDTFGRWRISDPRLYLERLKDERSAQSRLDDILGSETRNVVAKHDFIEAVRTSKDRKLPVDQTLQTDGPSTAVAMPAIKKGRTELEAEIYRNAAPKIKDYGIELLDVRFKRLNYNETVSDTIYGRMISEREQIAERFRSEGAGEAAKILGNKERDLLEIESEAYRKVQEIEGKADAEATAIYAAAYNQSSDAAELFGFLKTLETYRKILGTDSRLILTTDSDLFQFLKTPNASEAPASGAQLGTGAAGGGPLSHLPSLLDVKP